MGVVNVDVLHGVETPGNFYSQLSSGRITAGANILTVVPSGHYHPMFRSIPSQIPAVEFTTMQLETALIEMGVEGLGISGGVTFLDAYERKVQQFGTRVPDATTEHTRYRVNEAMGYIARISGTHQGQAMAEVRFVCSWDGTNDPIICSGSQPLSGTPSGDENFCSGPMKYGIAMLDGVQGIDIDFGVVLIQAGGDSEIFPTFLAIQQIIPVFNIQMMTKAAMSSFGGVSGGALINDVSLFFRRRKPDGTLVSDSDPAHIRLDITEGINITDDITGDGQTGNISAMRILGRAPDANSPSYTINTGVAIA